MTSSTSSKYALESATYRPLRDKDHPSFVLHGLAEDNTVFQPIRESGVWEPHLMAVLERFLRPDFVCLDIGANIGAITLPLARLAFRGHVYAFEASPEAHAILERNIAMNALPNVTATCAAITEHSGDTVEIFHEKAELGCAHMSSWLGRDGQTREQVKTLALDDYTFPDHVDFIKLDIEGGESAALAGMRRLLETSQPILTVEYNPFPIEKFQAAPRRSLYDTLTGFYSRIEIIGSDGGLQPVTCWEDLEQALAVHSWRDLLCTH